MENMRFKVGDLVQIKSLDWYNENKDENGNIRYKRDGSAYPIFFTKYMSRFCGETLTIKCVHKESYYMNETGSCEFWSDEMIEGLVEEETKPIDFTIKVTDTKGKVEVVIPEGYSYVIENDKLYFITEKKEVTYPKTYEECCEIFQYNKNLKIYPPFNADIPNYDASHLFDLLEALRKLRICRDVYWKIAGEEMGLGKPWEPDWESEIELKYTIVVDTNKVCEGQTIQVNTILAFPTEEMRDAFYENFKEEIEICKELL